METITAYKLSDGSIVEDENEAIEAEKILTFKKEMEKLAKDEYLRIDFDEDFVNFMDEHAEKLFAILSKRFAK
jgi:hypothetical protein